MEITDQHVPVSVGLYFNITTDLLAKKSLVWDALSNSIDKFVDYIMDNGHVTENQQTTAPKVSTLFGTL